ncbi:MAG TPA: class III extradiol ring-cleavage dioxygenase [Burkholderiales bacterium]|nr:class III extradiol ring-cleavage dioxygenase [Burkholderiales bacterium]
MSKLPSYFISHGGGPWPWMTGPFADGYEKLSEALRDMPRQTGRPKAILMVSAHWEEPEFTLMTAPRPGMFYDYYGFPPETYQIQYPAPSSPELAGRVRELAGKAGIPVRDDAERGYDHGAFVPLAVIYPDASVPVTQLSLKAGLDPEAHLAMGRALAPLREEGYLILGSGLSYHNLREFRSVSAGPPSHRFDAWLQDTLQSSPRVRSERLVHWEQAPSAREAHPREEHLIPLMVAAGAAENEPAERIYHEDTFQGRIAVSNFRFGAAPR